MQHVSPASVRPDEARTLLSLPPGGAAAVARIRLEGPMRGRLMDLGLTGCASVTRLFAAPSGDPRAYLVRGTVIALRNADAAGVELLPGAAQPGDAARRGDGAWD